ncbi:MAG: AAA family ATPase [Candidatus Micrarchaeia archaeon]
MLYIKSVTLDHFKSFKHANLLLSKGFNTIVGPNGSGKSNICDALLFCLGENSLHRLRANKLEDLITVTGEKRSTSKAYVKLELDGDEHIELVRGLRADGKSIYRLNGKRMTRQEVIEVLGKHGVYADERNTVAQGEVGRFVELNAKERRELIDAVAGIKEYELKKAEALNELEKVNMKLSEMQGIFQEKLAFLKELEKEKDMAQQYEQLSKRLKQLNYSILLAKLSITGSAIESFEKDLAELTKKREETGKRLAELTKQMNELEAKRKQLTQQLEESSKASNATNALLQSLLGKIAEIDAKIDSTAKQISEKETQKQQLAKSIEETKQKIEEDMGEAEKLKRTLGNADVQQKGGIEALAENISDLQDALRLVQGELSKVELELAKHRGNKSLLDNQLIGINTEHDELEKEINEKRQSLEESTKAMEEASKKLDLLNNEIAEISKRLDAANTRLLELKEKRALAAPKDKGIAEKIRKLFGEEDGFYGVLSDICTYSPEYAVAVEAAAGNRLNYLVVESIDVAEKIIDYLKSNSIGRATFIPLRDINVERQAKVDAKPLTSVIQYDSKFAKAIEFVFGGTFLVGSIEEAKAKGVGKARYVTIDGDIVESSGLVSGGAKPSLSPAVLGREIENAERQSKEYSAALKEKDELAFKARKELASAEARMQEAKESLEKLEKRKKELEDKFALLVRQLEEEKGKIAELEKKKEELVTKSELLGKELDDKTKELNSGYASQASKEAKEIEEKKIRLAELRKEMEMLEKALADYNSQSAKLDEELGKLRQEAEKQAKLKEELAKQKAEVEEKTKSASEKAKGLYEQINAIEASAVEISKQTGMLGSEAKQVEEKMEEAKVKKSQLEVRLSDLKAELGAYEAMEPVKGMSIEEMEKEASLVNGKISALGNVNMKAPEVYEAKKKEVDEAQAKLDTLATERQAVISMIEEIDKKKLDAFMSAFNEISKNFENMLGYIFPWKAKLVLENPNNPFEGGLNISVANRVSALSGGEKALLSLTLLFAIHAYRPSSIYVFDEIDAALDKENSKKLSQLIKELSKNAQFIVVSHNDATVLGADVAIGVVRNNGASQVVGIEVSAVKPKAGA